MLTKAQADKIVAEMGTRFFDLDGRVVVPVEGTWFDEYVWNDEHDEWSILPLAFSHKQPNGDFIFIDVDGVDRTMNGNIAFKV